jgi:carbon-monoxide dehydrogenase small subunit
VKVDFILNEKSVHIETDPLRRLLDVLREDFHLTGVKEGCGEGECGACTVLVGGKGVCSCIVPVGTVANENIVTIEGFRLTKRYTILERCFVEAGAVQCGFCTPGFILAAESLLSEMPRPDEAAIREGISGNLCRCTGYSMIVEAILRASVQGKGLW